MYQVLARKYRPRNFNELVGQNHVSRALTSALVRGRLHHAYFKGSTNGQPSALQRIVLTFNLERPSSLAS